MVKRILTTLTGIVATAMLLALPLTASAATGAGIAGLSLASNSTSVAAGSTFSVYVRENSGDAVVAVVSDLTFDSSLLTCVSVDTSMSAFVQGYTSACGAGTVSIARGTQGTVAPAGTNVIAVVTFRAVAASGTANITFAGSSEIDRSPDAVNICDTTCSGSVVGGSYVLTPAAGGRGGEAPAPTSQPQVLAADTTAPDPTPTAVAAPVVKPVVKPVVAATMAPAVAKKSKTGQTVFSVIVLVLVVLGAIAIAKREQVAKMVEDMKKKMNAKRSVKVAAPVVAAVATKAVAKKKAPAKKKPVAKKATATTKKSVAKKKPAPKKAPAKK